MSTPDDLQAFERAGFVKQPDGTYSKPKKTERHVGDQNSSQTSRPKSKHGSETASNGNRSTEAKNPGKRLVRITCFRVRKQDPDNGVYKFHIDAIRHAGLIHGDSEEEIELMVRQVRVSKKSDERTEITIGMP